MNCCVFGQTMGIRNIGEVFVIPCSKLPSPPSTLLIGRNVEPGKRFYIAPKVSSPKIQALYVRGLCLHLPKPPNCQYEEERGIC